MVEIYTSKIIVISPSSQWINHVDRVGTITEKWHIDGLGQDCSISSANALEILQYCTKPSMSQNNLGKLDMYHACQCIGRTCWAELFLACSSEMATLRARFTGSTWGPSGGRQDPGGPHVGPVNFAIWELLSDPSKINANYKLHKDDLAITTKENHKDEYLLANPAYLQPQNKLFSKHFIWYFECLTVTTTKFLLK